jgi:hypothetical protein
MSQVLVGVFDRREHAQAALDELLEKGFSVHDLQITTQRAPALGADGNPEQSVDEAVERSNSIVDSIGDMFRALFVEFGGKTEDEALYDEAIRRGSVVLTAHAADDKDGAMVIATMHRHGSVDVDSRAQRWRNEGWSEDKPIPSTLTAEEMDNERRLNALPMSGLSSVRTTPGAAVSSSGVEPAATGTARSVTPEPADSMVDGTSPLASASVRNADVLGAEPAEGSTSTPHGVRVFKRADA